MRIFFTQTHEKYINCLQNSNIVSSASTISTTCSNKLNSIDSTYFQMISDSIWEELGKGAVTTNIIPEFKNNLQTMSDFLSHNLLKACELAINSLLPAVIMIRDKQEELYSTVSTLNSTKSNKPENEEEIASWEANCNALESKKNTLIAQLEALCENVTSLENAINSLGEATTIEATNAILSGLNESLIDIDDIKISVGEPITKDKILSDYENGIFPFKINEKSWTEDENGISFIFEYTENGIKESGVIILPTGTTTNDLYKDIIICYNGGKIDVKNATAITGAVNYPTVIFSRHSLSKEDPIEYRRDERLAVTKSVATKFTEYFGSSDSSIHAVGFSRGGQDLYNMVALYPDFYDTATIINGSIKYDNVGNNYNYEPEKISSLESSRTKLSVFIASNDTNIPPEEQLGDLLNLDVNNNIYYVPLTENKSYAFDYDNISTEFPTEKTDVTKKVLNLVNNYNDNSINQSEDKKNIDVYIIDGAGHSGPQKSLSDQRFYDLIFGKD